jgi:hypothetical protein
MDSAGFESIVVQNHSILYSKHILFGMTKKAIHQALLQDKIIKRWYNNNVQGSRATADVYLRQLGLFCARHNLTPQDLAKMSPNDIYGLLVDYIEQHGKDFAGSYMKTTVKVVKSWLKENDIEIKKDIKIKGSNLTPTLKNERPPSQDELRQIFLAATPTTRVSCALMAHSGFRPEVLGHYHGDDGLRVKDFPEMEIKGKNVIFHVIPTMVIVRPELSKTKHQYFSFLGEEGCGYLKTLLEARLAKDEVITPETDIIKPKARNKHFMRATNIGDGVRNAIRRAGFPWRPYVLRAYFDTRLMIAESKGKIIRDYRQFFMGHVGDIEQRYTIGKGQLEKDTLDDIREAYKRSQEFLQTIRPAGMSEDETFVMVRKQILMSVGYTIDELSKLDLVKLEDAEIQRMSSERSILKALNNGNKQKLIDVDQLEKYLDLNWTFVAQPSKQKVIVRPPG